VRFSGLWRHPSFRTLWAGETVSLLGSQVTRLALPLTASMLLQASPFQMGLLGASQTIPFLVFGLAAGVWVDRLRRRPIMLATDVGRAVLLASIPIAAVAGMLRLEQLVLVAFAVGTLDVFFGLAYASFLPSVVRREELAEGNAKLALSAEVARVAGPGLAGALVQLLTAPLAIAADAASFLASALALARLGASEPPSALSSERRGLRLEVAEGMRLIRGQPIIRALVGSLGLANVGDGLLFGSGLYVLFATRDLGLEPAVLGWAMAGVGAGGLVGAALAVPVTRRCGIGGTFLGAMILWGGSYLGVAFIDGPPSVAAVLLAATLAFVGTVNPIAGTSATTLRQAIVPDRLQGRVTAVAGVVAWTSISVGAIVGGIAAERIGIRATIAMSGGFPLLGFVWLLVSPVRHLRQLPGSNGLHAAVSPEVR